MQSGLLLAFLVAVGISSACPPDYPYADAFACMASGCDQLNCKMEPGSLSMCIKCAPPAACPPDYPYKDNSACMASGCDQLDCKIEPGFKCRTDDCPADFPFGSCTLAKMGDGCHTCPKHDSKECYQCGGFPGWAIAVIVVSCVLVLAIPIGITICCCCGLLCFAQAVAQH